MFASILDESGARINAVSRSIVLVLAVVGLCQPQNGAPAMAGQPPPHKPGVSAPDVRIPLYKLIPDAKIALGGSPDWIAIDTDVWVSNKPKNSVMRLNRQTKTLVQTITGFHKPCSGLAVGFGALWVPNCGDQTLARVDLTTGHILQTIPVNIADSEGGLTVGDGSVWVLTKDKSSLARIDPQSNSTSSIINVPDGCYTPAFGFGSVWVSCTKQNTVLRVDPKTNSIANTIPVGPEPRFLTVSEDAVWTLNQGDGTVTRISPANNTVAATIELGIPGPGGDISAGEGSVWATSFGFPISRIDPKTNRVVQQFVGEGGDAIRAGNGELWLSNYKSGVEWKLNPTAVAAIK
jgi:streptogramin lyase